MIRNPQVKTHSKNTSRTSRSFKNNVLRPYFDVFRFSDVFVFSHNTCCLWVSLTCSPEHTARQCRNFTFPGGAVKRGRHYCCYVPLHPIKCACIMYTFIHYSMHMFVHVCMQMYTFIHYSMYMFAHAYIYIYTYRAERSKF